MPTTVILGTGVIGLSTAYYLSLLSQQQDNTNNNGPAGSPTTPTATAHHAHAPTHPPREQHHIHLVEPCPELFASASGKAAGFLARDWFAPAVAPLGAFSFDLHRDLAQAHAGAERWAWGESVSYSLDRDESDVDEDEVWQSEDEDTDVDYEGGSEEAEGHDASARHSEHATSANGVSTRGQNGVDARASATEPQTRSRTQSTDLRWFMDGSSRATLLNDTDPPPKPTSTTHRNGNGNAKPKSDEYPRWIRAKKSALQAISDRSTTAQVDPHRLCEFLLAECQARGVTLHQPARATQLVSPDPVSDHTSIRIEYLDPADLVPPDANSESNGRHGSPGSEGSHGSGSWHGSSDGRSEESLVEPSTPPDACAEGLAGGDYFTGVQGKCGKAEEKHDDVKDTSESNGTHEKEHSPHAHCRNAHAHQHPPARSARRSIDVPVDSIVIAAGCWTPRVYRTLFPNAGRIPRVTALAGYSAVFKSRRWAVPAPYSILDAKGGKPAGLRTGTNGHNGAHLAPPPTCHAVFTGDHAGYSPEIFSRLNGDVWLGGLNSSTLPLPALPSHAVPSPAAVATLMHTAQALLGASSSPSPSSDDEHSHDDAGGAVAQPLRAALCFRPVAPTGRPVLARMHAADLGDGAGTRVRGGVFVATGHGPWGISLGLGTGYVVSEMVLGRETSVDVRALGRWEAQGP